jgi:hypothetical protein
LLATVYDIASVTAPAATVTVSAMLAVTDVMSAQNTRFPAPTPEEVQTPTATMLPQLVVTIDANCVAVALDVPYDVSVLEAATQPPMVARAYEATVTSDAAHAAFVSLEPVVVCREIHHAVGRVIVLPDVPR